MFGFTCLIKADTDLVKRCLQESKNDVELLTALYDEVLDTDTDAEGMWPTEELATPVEEYSLIFGCREASELIYFAEGMRKRALYSAIGAASLALKRWNEAGINIKTSLEEVLNTIPMGSTEAYTLSCATDILCNTPNCSTTATAGRAARTISSWMTSSSTRNSTSLSRCSLRNSK